MEAEVLEEYYSITPGRKIHIHCDLSFPRANPHEPVLKASDVLNTRILPTW